MPARDLLVHLFSSFTLNINTPTYMADSFKRALTADQLSDNQSSAQFNRSDVSPELTAQLRNVGARVRKSVTEGYITPPTSRSFTKAQSTTTIFSSAKDINREVFASSYTIVPTGTDPANPPKKRSRSIDRLSDSNVDEDHNMAISNNVPAPQPTNNSADRVTRPLRKHRPPGSLMQTQSLPVGAFRFSYAPPDPSPTNMAPTTEETEEDWSTTQPTTNSDRSTFEPVVFD